MRVKTETIIDGYSGFLLLDKNDSPKVALHIENEIRRAMKKYQKLHPDKPLPHITPMCSGMPSARTRQTLAWTSRPCSMLWVISMWALL